MNNFTIKILGCLILLFLVFGLRVNNIAYASYQKIAPGDTITLGEFVFDDNFVATTTPCTIGITDSGNTERVSSTTSMTANNDGWHYYTYTTASDALSGIWPSVMICGSVQRGDLVIIDKSFIVDQSTIISTEAIRTIVNESLIVATSSLSAIINANTDTRINNASTSVVALINANTNAQTSGITSTVNANTDAQVLNASTSIAAAISSSQTAINANTNAQTSGITSAVNAVTESASSSLAASIQTASSSVVSQILSSIVSIPNNVWNIATRTLTSTLLGDGRNLATESYIDTATSTLTAEIQNGWSVTLSDFGETTVNTAYKAKLQVLNYESSPTDADSLPTLVITDSVGTIQVPAGVMTRESNGTYSYSYSINGSAVGGIWETEVSIVVDGKTIKVNDYWTVSSSPADVNITEITDKVIPTITANIRIDNMGTSNSDFYYVYCIVNSEDNLCGGSDDIDYGSDTAYVAAQNHINLALTLDEVPNTGTYWFKVKARALSETNWAASSEQFVAESEESIIVIPPVNPPGGGGGGGGGAIPITPIIPSLINGADFNGDNKVNSVDFSILLAFWHKKPPFKNQYVDINKDNKVDSVDFSILLYRWKK